MMTTTAAIASPPALSRRCFRDKLEARIAATNSLLCVGLDPHETELGLDLVDNNDADDAVTKCDAAFTFCKLLVDATAEYTSCYKPNAAFFEALGEGGMECLRRLCRDVIPADIPILLDVKRGDIGTTASAYAVACYDYIGADAVTLSPLMGWDSISPFVTGTVFFIVNASSECAIDARTTYFAKFVLWLVQKSTRKRELLCCAKRPIPEATTCSISPCTGARHCTNALPN
jgi:orotidine 5'-phosphate decarboxylase subfamily 2